MNKERRREMMVVHAYKIYSTKENLPKEEILKKVETFLLYIERYTTIKTADGNNPSSLLKYLAELDELNTTSKSDDFYIIFRVENNLKYLYGPEIYIVFSFVDISTRWAVEYFSNIEDILVYIKETNPEYLKEPDARLSLPQLN